ncbi:MAG: hypothetical protein WC057_08010 [Dehalococcoidales bacterium]
MCNTFSFLVFSNEDLFFVPSVDSHENQIALKGINENGFAVQFARCEYVPTCGKFADLDSYKFRLDEDRTPDWWTEEIQERTISRIRSRIRGMIVSKDQQVLGPGVWILSGNPTIGKLLDGCIIITAESATIQYAGSATIRNAGSATIQNARLAAIQDAGSATIQYAGSATIQYAGSATIQNAGSATIQNAESATIRNAESATIINKQSATIVN